MNDALERKESIKAGSCGAIAAGIGYGLLTTSIAWFDRAGLFAPVNTSHLDLNLAIQIAIAAMGGFLFGMTYRYIIRTDRNHHLQSGAVLAFGLVRGLAQIQINGLDLAELLRNGSIVLESLFLFAIARYSLDYALSMRWILPFNVDSRSPYAQRSGVGMDSE